MLHKKKNVRVYISLLLTVFILQLASSCTPIRPSQAKRGVLYSWKKGDSLEQVSKKFSISVDKLRQENSIIDPDDLVPGIKLWIPTTKKVLTVPPENRFTPSKGKMIWPSYGTISSGYGKRHGRMHTGIDITRDQGKKILAAKAGIVEFTGPKKGYGLAIIIKHGNGLKTLYGHNSKLFVRKGYKVKQGAIIAQMGSTGRSSGIHLHFEVRINGKHQNPLRYLPVR